MQLDNPQNHDNLFDAIGDAIFIQNRDGKFLAVNNAVEKMYGYPRDYFIGKSPSDFMAPGKNDPDSIKAHFTGCISENGVERFEFWALRADGSVFLKEVVLTKGQFNGKACVIAIGRDVSDRKHLELELESAKRRTEHLVEAFEAVTEGVAVVDAEDRFVFCSKSFRKNNQAAIDYLSPGCFFEDHLRVLLDKGVVSQARGREEEWLNERMEKHQNPRGKFEHLHDDGHWFLLQESCLRDGGRITLALDITEQKNAEQDLLAQSRIISNMAEGALLIRASDVSIVYANPSAEKMFGYHSGEMQGKHMSSFHAQAGLTQGPTPGEIRDELENHGVWRGEILNAKKDGTEFWSSVGVSTLEHPAYGELWVSIRTDVTVRKEIEEKLRINEERFRHYAESSSEWYWETDKDHRYTAITGLHMYTDEWQSRYVIGNKRIDLARNQEDTGNGSWSQHIADLKAHRPFKNFEYLMKGDGDARWVSASGIPRHDAEGNFIGYRGTGNDITRQKLDEELLRRAQKMEAVGQLTGGIAHDFNNILGIVLGNISLLKSQKYSDEITLKRMNSIQGAAQRAADLTKQLLDFSRLQATDVVISDINRIILEMDDLVKRSLTPEVEVSKRLATDLWMTGVNVGDFQDTLLNLVLNARDAMPGGGRVTIETSNCTLGAAYCFTHPDITPGQYVLLSVGDTGTGISSKQLGKIYEPFYTTKETGKGTGLGLSMVFGFITRSNGYIDVQSEPGNGATFHLYFPRAVKPAPAQEITGDQSEPLTAGCEMILTVDDEEEILELAKESLEALGYRVLTATNGKEALKLLTEHSAISLLFSDVVMPGMNGYELAEQALQKRKDLKVLLTSGHAKKMGNRSHWSFHILEKPYLLEKLASQVRSLLDESKSVVH